MSRYKALFQSTQRFLIFIVLLSLMILNITAGASEEILSKNTNQNVGEPKSKLIDRREQVDTKTPLPLGDWSFSAHPYLGPDYESRPVIVFSVASNAAKGLTITKVGVRNNSSKSVVGLKLGWYLSTEEDHGSILLEGSTPLIALQRVLLPDQRVFLDLPIVTFAKVIKRLQRRDILVGNFRIEVDASEVLYEDGSTSSVTNSNNSRRF